MGVKFDPANSYILDLPSRRIVLDPGLILGAIGLRQGHVFADVGCGTGYFVLPAARVVGHAGVIFAVDIQPLMLSHVAQKAVSSGIDNVRLVLAQESAIPLPSELLDLALIANVLPELDDPQAFCAELARLLKPSGHVSIIDWHKRQMQEGPCQEIRIPEEDALRLCTSGPLGLSRRFAPGPRHYGFILERRA